MLRRVHSIPGLAAALLVSFMAITGAVLSVQPLLEQVSTPSAGRQVSVAELAAEVMAALPQTESIVRSASGTITAHDGAVATRIDPATGESLGVATKSAFFSFFTELHRSLFFGDAGRIVAGVAAGAMAVLALSGVALLVHRMGGWRMLFARVRGTLSQRLHVELGRMAIVGLLLSAMTGVYLTLATFGLVSDGMQGFGFPATGSGGAVTPIAELAALQAVPLSDLRELTLPVAGDASDVFTLTTKSGVGYVDQATGDLIDFVPNSPMQTLYEAIYTLHTGQGLWWLAALLGMMSLAVPGLMITGLVVWIARRRSRPRLAGDAGWRQADTVILVGSESNSTWGFAATLQAALVANGNKVHVAAMNALRPRYPAAQRLLVLAATYGNGVAPASARQFLGRLAQFEGQGIGYAVLGFGDRKFQQFCRYAEEVEAALGERGLSPLVAFATIDRQSAQAFAAWGRQFGEAALGRPLTLVHEPVRPGTWPMVLLDRQDYGIEVQAPTVVLRFGVPKAKGWRQALARLRGEQSFQPGDLVGIMPPGDAIPRYYSISSHGRDGVLEICVRKQVNGVCSDYLFGLQPGDWIEGFVRQNPEFHPVAGRKPLILIGAGAGVAPLAGFVRENRARRPISLYFGGRDPSSDFLYGDELRASLAHGRLSQLATAFSRVMGGRYVQDKVLEDAEALRDLVRRGAQVMVCGGMDMAEGVRASLDAVLAPLELSVEMLRSKGRYAEDVY